MLSAAIGICLLLALLFIRVPIGISLILTSFAGIWFLLGLGPALSIMTIVPYEFVGKWTLSSVPMFLLMGYICYHAGLTKGLYDACRSWLARLPGGLAIASVFGSAGFAAVTGSSIACAAAMGRIAVPEMLASKYSPALATGTIAAAGTLGALIPPSILLILFGIFAEVPINQLLMGGVGVGVLTAISYVITILIHATLRPQDAPREDKLPPLAVRIKLLRNIWPIVTLIAVVLGGLFSGFFTATEAGAVGAFFSMVIAVTNKTMSFKVLYASVKETLVTTSALFLIGIGANMLSRYLAISGTDDLIVASVSGLVDNPMLLLLVLSLFYLLLGMFLDPIGAMLLTLPVLLPILREANIDLIWFGIFLAKFLEMGMITPPIGLNVFVVKGSVGDAVSLTTIFRGVVWFLLADLVVVSIMVAFPSVVTYLPSLLG